VALVLSLLKTGRLTPAGVSGMIGVLIATVVVLFAARILQKRVLRPLDDVFRDQIRIARGLDTTRETLQTVSLSVDTLQGQTTGLESRFAALEPRRCRMC
jgi:hypothetical protein